MKHILTLVVEISIDLHAARADNAAHDGRRAGDSPKPGTENDDSYLEPVLVVEAYGG